MNYSKIYDNLIEKRLTIVIENGESHHILPKCLGGTNSIDNLVTLTYREHFIAHRLLSKIYPNNYKLKYAVYMMTLVQSDKSRLPNSHQISIAKKELKSAARIRINSSEFNPGKTERSRLKAKNRMLSEDNPIKKNPHKNHTAYPVIVLYEDGTKIIYECASYIPIPYQTIKWMKKYNKGSKKHGIVSITRYEN